MDTPCPNTLPAVWSVGGGFGRDTRAGRTRTPDEPRSRTGAQRAVEEIRRRIRDREYDLPGVIREIARRMLDLGTV